MTPPESAPPTQPGEPPATAAPDLVRVIDDALHDANCPERAADHRHWQFKIDAWRADALAVAAAVRPLIEAEIAAERERIAQAIEAHAAAQPHYLVRDALVIIARLVREDT